MVNFFGRGTDEDLGVSPTKRRLLNICGGKILKGYYRYRHFFRTIGKKMVVRLALYSKSLKTLFWRLM